MFIRPIISVINESAYKIIEYTKKIEINLNENSESYQDNCNIINGKLLLPLSFCLVNTWNILKSFKRIKNPFQVIFEKIKIHKPFITISDINIVTFTINLSEGLHKILIIFYIIKYFFL
jgi:fatty acid synthase